MTETMELQIEPYEVADETFVIPWILEAPPIGLISVNSMIIRGAEPVIVDTGAPAYRAEWLEQAWNIVDPTDVKWIFLSHDDRDHSGNLLEVLAACPNATILTNWFSIGRMAEEWMTPLDRCRFMNDGDVLELPDRTLRAVRPPVFDNPTTRGLFDDSTGAYWAVDSFAVPMQAPTNDAADLADDEFREGEAIGAMLIAAWHPWLDNDRFGAYVDQVQGMGIEVVASCHAPAIRGERIAQGFDAMRALPTSEPWSPFTQADLEMWLSMMPGG
jgi:flavorubredoxin